MRANPQDIEVMVLGNERSRAPSHMLGSLGPKLLLKVLCSFTRINVSNFKLSIQAEIYNLTLSIS